MAEIIGLISKDILDKWDGLFYGVRTLTSLGSKPTVIVDLFNHDGQTVSVAFDLHKGVEIISKNDIEEDPARLGRIEKLANDIVNSWDQEKQMDGLKAFFLHLMPPDVLVEDAKNHMVKLLSSLTKNQFDKKWDDYYKVVKAKRG